MMEISLYFLKVLQFMLIRVRSLAFQFFSRPQKIIFAGDIFMYFVFLCFMQIAHSASVNRKYQEQQQCSFVN